MTDQDAAVARRRKSTPLNIWERQRLADSKIVCTVLTKARKQLDAAIAALRELDAQQLDAAAGELYGTSRANTNTARILQEEATKMRGAGRAARTPQEPT